MVKKARGSKSRSGWLNKALVIAAVVLVVLGLVFGGVLWWQGKSGHMALPTEEGKPPTPPKGQGPQCPDVRLFAVGGTHESKEDDDPFNPTTTALPGAPAMLWAITQPINEKYNNTQGGDKRADAYTLPYNSGFRVLVSNNPKEKSFDQSVAQGTQALEDVMKRTAEECPATKYFLVGYSQGAVVAGDVANAIGNGDQAAVPADRMLGVVLLSDARRQPGVGQDTGTKVGGVGIEVALKNSPFLPLVSAFGGFTMQGAREGGFGKLHDQVFEICGTGDQICDVDPAIAQNASAQAQLPGELLGASGHHLEVHTGYGTTAYWKSDDGKPAVDWIKDKALSLIEAAPNTH
jgi:hypothetical protein